jgi:putative transposase
MKVTQAYRFALNPSPAQEQALRSHAGAARFAWNWGLARCNARYETEGKWYSAAELHRLWNAEKKAEPTLAWWGENSKCAYQEAFRDLDRALHDFIKSKKGLRKGKRLGFPKAKKRGKCKDSFRFGAGVMRCSGTTVTLPRLGAIRTHESTRNSPAGWRTAPRVSCRPRSLGRLSGGSCRSRSRSGARSQNDTPGPAPRSASTWE